MVVRAKKEIQRSDGSLIKFDDNACVLVNKAGDPIGTRLNGQFYYGDGFPTELLTSIQVLWERNYEESNGLKFCLWRLCMCKLLYPVAKRIISLYAPCFSIQNYALGLNNFNARQKSQIIYHGRNRHKTPKHTPR